MLSTRKIQLIGSNFRQLETLSCRFGESFTAPAHFQSTERISCLVPSFGIRNISVSVANNGHDFSKSVSLQVIQAPSISSISPSAGPSQGGIPLRLRVRELNPALTPYYSHLSCRFGMIDVLAVLQDEGNSVLCILPGQLANSTIDVSVVDDGRAVVNNSIKFTYTSPPFIHGIAPSMGPVGGSTLVSLSIDALNKSLHPASCVCYFGEKSSIVQIEQNWSSVACKSPAVSKIGIYYLTVFCHGFHIQGWHSFQFVQDMVIEGFYPSTAQSPAAVMVTVYGNGFHQLDTLTCKFGERKGLSRASLLSSTAIRCLSRTQNPGNATLSISYNDRDWVKAPSPFLSISRSSTIRITPTFGSINGGTMVTVWGEAVKKAGMQHCVFGTSNVKMIISGSVGLCLSPARNLGSVNVFLEGEDSVERAGPTKFQFVAEHQVDSMVPTLGKTVGGTIVSILGLNFKNSTSAGCRFGDLFVNSTFVHSELVVCSTPRHAARFVQVEVTNNGQDFSKGGVRFLYDDALIESIFPLKGPIFGGTQVHIRTKNLLQTHTLSCLVGGSKVEMQRASAFEAWCVTPPSTSEGFAEIQISLNNQEYASSGVRFEYQSAVHVDRLVPSFGSLNGNTRVKVSGSGFVDSTSLSCRFGVIRSAAQRFLSSTQIECISPSSTVGSVEVYVANNAVDFGAEHVRFEYHEAVGVQSLEPSTGVVRGSTAVTFTGIHFRRAPTFGCRFGSVVVQAEWLSDGRGFCSTPSAPRFGLYQFEVTSNGIDFSDSDLHFLFYEPVIITSLHPSIAPASSGHTIVTVNVESSSLSSFPSWKCVFGDLTLSVPAVIISSEMLQCVAPMTTIRDVPFMLTRNGQNLEGGKGHSFQFIEDTTLLGLKPNSGLTEGGTTVFLFGSNIQNTSDLQCRFGSAIAPATFLSSALAICRSPAQAPGSVDVELSNARISWTRSRLLFTYLLCPKGRYCPGNSLLLSCPAGSYCDQDRQSNHTLCPPSTYQPSTGQTSCLSCPRGRFCAEEGLISPGVPCVAGYVCDGEGLRVPSKPCPPGHYCVRGTSTSDPKSKLTRSRPYPCPRGFYCTYGVKTPVSEINNFSTPQPCIPGYFCSAGSETPHGQGPCPSGFHCPTYAPGVIKACGPGTFCPSVANAEPMHCLPGTSNSLYGQIKCMKCPKGTPKSSRICTRKPPSFCHHSAAC